MFDNFDIICNQCGSQNVELIPVDSFDGDVVIKVKCLTCEIEENKQFEIRNK